MGKERTEPRKGRWTLSFLTPCRNKKLKEYKSRVNLKKKKKKTGKGRKFRWNSLNLEGNDEFQDLSYQAQAHSTLMPVLEFSVQSPWQTISQP